MIRRLIALLIAYAWLSGCGGRASGPADAIPPAPAGLTAPSREAGVNELPEPPVVRAVHGVAKFSLAADIDPATLLPAFVYKHQQGVAPTIDISPGQTFEIDLTDDFPPHQGVSSYANLHFHGLTVSPRGNSDNVLGMLAKPGQKLHYVVHVPDNQEPGLYWYHMHVHGETTYQVGEGGMSGAIVIEGLTRHFPELAKMKQRLIVMRATAGGQNAKRDDDVDEPSVGMSDGMSEMAHGDTAHPPGYSNSQPCSRSDGLTVTLNGAYHPDITIAPGEKQFFRVVNATAHKTMRLNVEGEEVEVVAIDGYALDTYPGTAPTLTEPSVIMPPASRAEFVVTGPKSGHAKFQTLCYNSGPDGDPDPYLYLAHIGAPKHHQAGGDFSNRSITVGASQPDNAYTTALPPPSQKRLVVFSQGPGNSPIFFINGKSFDMHSPPMFVVHVGTVEEWHVVNVTAEIHDFHIHQVHFLVESINGAKVAHPHWADSVIVPHRSSGTKSVPGSLMLLMDFRDPVIRGEFLFHCHILEHEDAGMMAKIEAI